LQNRVTVFAEVGRGGADLAVEAGDLAGLRHQMLDRALQAQCLHLRIGEGLQDVVDRPAGKTRVSQEAARRAVSCGRHAPGLTMPRWPARHDRNRT